MLLQDIVWKTRAWYGKAENVAFQTTKSEIDTYLEDGLIKHDDNDDEDSFNILQWWNDKESKYRILSQMAHDLLSIPITSVASKNAFSTGGQIVSDSRSSLMPNTVEALVCLGNWVKNDGDPMHEVLTKEDLLAQLRGVKKQLKEAEEEQYKAEEDAVALRAEIKLMQQQLERQQDGSISSIPIKVEQIQAMEHEVVRLKIELQQESLLRHQEQQILTKEQLKVATLTKEKQNLEENMSDLSKKVLDKRI
ncbi:hypothetical protein EJ110_NYTH43313 [Nymphaea thermarum]|nr:hypothetical protein EJ110_NYTH43313 [Nymphaea thermarum]